ncbi:MAG: M23 family metallopeptidase [bacterium]|nr:M23 family metallopeptidase [bacterium]
MGARDYNYDDDQNRDYSDLSDQNQSALGRAQERWGNAQVFDGGKSSSSKTSNGYDADSLIAAENSATSASRNQSEESVLGGENSPSNRFNYTGGGTHKSRNAKIKGAGKFGFFKSKKAAILGGAGLIGISGGFMFFSFFGAMLAPIHIMEIITEKIGWSGASTDLIKDKLWHLKIKEPGINCKTRLYCRFASVSDAQVKNIEKAGFKVETNGKTLFGKNKITSLEHIESGTNITNDSRSIKSMLRDPKLKASWDKGYKGHFHTFLDKANKKFKKWFNIKGAKPDNKGKSTKQVQDDGLETSNKDSDKTNSTEASQSPDYDNDDELKNLDENAKKEPRTAEADLAKMGKEVGEEMKGLSMKDKLAAGASKAQGFVNKAQGYLNPINKLCFVFAGTSIVISGIKLTRFLVLARFAFLFLSTASKMKANQATTEEVESLGNPTMGIPVPEDGEKSENKESSFFKRSLKYLASVNSANNSTKSFTESQGWRALAYNDSVGSLDDSAKNYSVGLTGKIKEIMNGMKDLLTWGSKMCKTISMAGAALAATAAVATIVGCVVGGVTLLGCIGSFLAGAVSGLTVLASVAQLAFELFKEQIVTYIGSFLVGEIVNSKTLGQDYGNAIISGAGATMSKNASAGGGASLNKSQALALYFENEKMIAEKAEYERATRSPFDPTSHHTFLGSIIATTMPYQRQMATLGGFVPAISSIASRAFSSIIPTSHADDAAGFSANMEVCDDTIIKGTGAATDIFCNPIIGIDTNVAKNKSLDEIIEKMQSNGDLATDSESDNIETLAKGDFKKYLKSCYDRKYPIGIATNDDDTDYGEKCNKEQIPMVDYYATLMTYHRIEEGLEDSEPSTNRHNSSEVDSDLAGLPDDFIWPIKGASSQNITSGFGPRVLEGQPNNHGGIDLGYPTGTPVYATSDGQVIQDTYGYTSGGGGPHTIIIKHNNDVYSAYLHMSTHIVNPGDNVKKGQKIGEVGNEGWSYGAHLHFEIHKGGFGKQFAIDPLKVLEK